LVHPQTPWLRASSRMLHGPGFVLHRTISLEDLNQEKLGHAYKEVYSRFGPLQSTQQYPAEVSIELLQYLDQIKTKADRGLIAKFVQAYGTTTPPFQLVGGRVAAFLHYATKTIE
jgi:hypothetical protein